MATQLQHRRGSTAENNSFPGAEGELTVDLEKNVLVVHNNGPHPQVNAATLLSSQAGKGASLVGINDAGGLYAATTVEAALQEVKTSDNIGYLPAGADASPNRSVQDKLREIVSVKDFGAVGDGVADDGAALNLALAAFRNRVNAVADQAGCIELDLCGGVYRTTISLNTTALSTWGWKISGGTIVGECTGKNVLDLTGSRGGHLADLIIYGSETSVPRVGLMAARATGGGQTSFCDNNLYENVSCIGYYSLAAGYMYAQETTTYSHCRFWNYNKDGYAAIHSGNDSVAEAQSDYITPVTGSHSYINDKYINCDYRFLPSGNIATVISIGNANNPLVTATGHPFKNGDLITIGGITAGMTNINNLIGTVGSATANRFVLNGVDSTLFGAFSGFATAVICQTKPTVYFSRGEQHSFDTCYVTNYGSDNFQIDFPDTIQLKQIELDLLFEGIGSRSHVRFTPGENSRQILGFSLKTYNTHCRDSVFSTNTVGEYLRVGLYDCTVSVSNISYSSPILLDVASKYSMYNAKVFYPTTVGFNPAALAAFSGMHSNVQTGMATAFNVISSSSVDGLFTPVVSSTAGTITSYTASGYATKVGNLVFVKIAVTITNNGTGGGSLNVSMPVANDSNLGTILYGRANAVSGSMLQGYMSAGSPIVVVRTYNNGYPAATGETIYLSGTYPAA